MKISRVYDPKVLNRAVNEPEVLAYVAPGYESFDLSDFIKDRQNIVLRCGAAFAIFDHAEKAGYEGHFLFPSHIRGQKAVSAAKKILNEMFTKHRAITIHGRVSRDHRAARVMTRRLGFEPVGAGRDALDEECIHYVLDRDWETSR